MTQEYAPRTPALRPESLSAEKRVGQTTCCIVGTGPAGAVLALLLARQGIPIILLEAHRDFAREFRGDTLHSSVMEILDEIGVAARLLELPHTKVHRAVATADEVSLHHRDGPGALSGVHH